MAASWRALPGKAMRRARHAARMAITRLLRQDAYENHAADFGDEALHAQLRAGAILGRSNGIASYRPDEPEFLDRHLAEHVASRRTPRFFCPPERVAAVMDTLEQILPGWGDGLARDIENLSSSHLPVYAESGPALSGDFDWDALPAGPGSDLLYPVQIHRFAFLPRLVLGIVRGLVPEDLLLAYLDRWMQLAASGDSNRPYCSTLVVTQRLLALTWAVHFLLSENTAAPRQRLLSHMLRIIAADVRFLLPRVGRSVANNHLLVDYFAGWFVAAVWPEFVPEERGITSATPAWERELLRQTYPDGGGFEHCTHYHEFACEMAVCYLLWNSGNGHEVDPAITTRIERMLRFQHEVAGRVGVPFPLGDAAEDPMLPLDAAGGWACGSLSMLYREIFGASVQRVDARDPGVERAIWMLAGDLSKVPAANTSNDDGAETGEGFVSFPDSGLYVMHEPHDESALLFRTGPAPGTDLFAGHMHADFLSVFLRVDRRPVIEDPGTYAYPIHATTHGVTWRSYLMGPQAHNGLVLDGLDPLGKVTGPFRPRESSARVESVTGGCPDALTWVTATMLDAGAYSGWNRLVVHVTGRYWLVVDDTARISRDVGAAFHLQFAPSLQVTVREGATCVESTDGRLLATVQPWNCGPAELFSASVDPVAGWVSPRYGELVPASQARHALAADRDLSAFIITAGEGDAPPATVNGVERVAGGYRVTIDAQGRKDLMLLDVKRAGSPMHADALSFRGNALWLRTDDGRPVALRCVDALSLDAAGMSLSPGTLERARETGRARITSNGHEVLAIDW